MNSAPGWADAPRYGSGFYRRTAREIKRLDSTIRSFTYSAFSEQVSISAEVCQIMLTTLLS